MNLQSILADIHALEEDLLAFERKYGVRSETFYAAYASGEEPEDDSWVLDFTEWASVYRTWLSRQAEYREAGEFEKEVAWLSGSDKFIDFLKARAKEPATISIDDLEKELGLNGD